MQEGFRNLASVFQLLGPPFFVFHYRGAISGHSVDCANFAVANSSYNKFHHISTADPK